MKRVAIHRSSKVLNAECPNKATMQATAERVKKLMEHKATRRRWQINQAPALLAHHPMEPLDALWSVLNDKSLLGPELPMAIVNDPRCGIQRVGGSNVTCKYQIKHRRGVTIKPASKETNDATPLILAIRAKHKECVVELLDHSEMRDMNKSALEFFDKHYMSAMHHAAANGDTATMQLLIAKGIGVDTNCVWHRTPIDVAADKGHVNVVSFLIQSKADVSHRQLHAAAENGHLDVVKTLVEHGMSVNQGSYNGTTALHFAARAGHLPVVEYLVSVGANVNAIAIVRYGETPLDYAALKKDNLAIVEFLISKGARISDTLLPTAVENNNVELVEYLASIGAPVNGEVNGQTLLYVAVSKGNLETIKILLKCGANPKAKNRYGCSKCPWQLALKLPSIIELFLNAGSTVSKAELLEAFESSEEKVVQLLLAHYADSATLVTSALLHPCSMPVMKSLLAQGASVAARDERGATPLHIVCEQADDDTTTKIKLLVEHNANVSATDANGKTPLHYAADTACTKNNNFYCNYKDMIRSLLSYGADPRAEDKDGNTPLSILIEHLAKKQTNKEAVLLPLNSMSQDGSDDNLEEDDSDNNDPDDNYSEDDDEEEDRVEKKADKLVVDVIKIFIKSV